MNFNTDVGLLFFSLSFVLLGLEFSLWKRYTISKHAKSKEEKNKTLILMLAGCIVDFRGFFLFILFVPISFLNHFFCCFVIWFNEKILNEKLQSSMSRHIHQILLHNSRWLYFFYSTKILMTKTIRNVGNLISGALNFTFTITHKQYANQKDETFTQQTIAE